MVDEPETMVRDMLRTRLTDPNSSRVVGTPYIVDDWPYEDDLVFNNFPRISITKQFENEKMWGLNSTDFWGTYRLQIDVWCKMDQPLTISGTNYTGMKQAIKISRDVEEAIRAYWITDLANTNKLIVLTSYNTYSPKLEYDYALFRQTADCTFSNIRKT